MKIKVTNSQTIEYPDDLAPEDVAALFENPADRADEDDDDLDGEAEEDAA